MQLLSNKKSEEDIFVKLGSEKDKRKDARHKDESIASIPIDELIEKANGLAGIFPGGYSTLEELLEVIPWAQLGIHDKPVKFPKYRFPNLQNRLTSQLEEGFVISSERHIIVSAPTVFKFSRFESHYAEAKSFIVGHQNLH